MMRVTVVLQTNCLEELTRPAPNHQGMAGRSDWVHIYHSVLHMLTLPQVSSIMRVMWRVCWPPAHGICVVRSAAAAAPLHKAATH
jgi:hypothetical protein